MNTTVKVKQVLWWILLANLAVAVTKIILGNIIASVSMTADGFHSLADGSSNIVALVGLALAAKPLDRKHPYGHGRFELLTSLFIGGMLLFVAHNIFGEAYERLRHPVAPQFEDSAIWVLVITLIINILVCWYESRKGHELDSYLLIADATHTKSDIFVSLGVLGTLISLKFGAPPIIDSIVSMIVGCFVIYAGWEIIRDTGAVLADKAALDHEQVADIVRQFPEVLGVHRIRSRGNGSDVFLDMHIKLDPLMSLQTAHSLAHDIEDALKDRLNPDMNVIIHTEPYREQPYKK